MATIKAVIRRDKVKTDGTAKVNIAICHKQKTAYIPTSITCKAEYFAGGRIIKGKDATTKNMEILALLNDYKDKLDDIYNIDYLTVVQIKERIIDAKKIRTSSLSEIITIMISESKSHNSQKVLITLDRLLQSYNKGKEIDMMSIDTAYVNKFYKFLQEVKCNRDRPYSPQSIKSYMVRFKQVVDYATKNGIVKYETSPFLNIKLIPDVVRENKMTNEDLKRLHEYVPNDKQEAFAKDIFFISFFSGGMNLIDIVKTRFDGDIVEYRRSKIESRTNGRYTVRFRVFPELRAIVDRYIDKDTGYLDFRKSELIKDATYSYNSHDKVCHNITSYISTIYKSIGRELDIRDLTFYSARKCFAQIGLNLGISDNVIDYLLGHTPTKRGMISAYSRVNEELGEMAMELIFEYAFNPTDLRQIFRKNILQKLNE